MAGEQTELHPKHLGILFSGSATTAQAIVRACELSGELHGVVAPVVAIASKPDAKGIEPLKKLGVEVQVVDYKEWGPQRLWGKIVADILRDCKVDITAQLGLIPRVSQNVLDAANITFNQHPACLDRQYGGLGINRADFGGRGMMGATAVAATLAYSLLTGENPWLTSTTHYVTPEVDDGLVISEVNKSIDPLQRMRVLSPNINGYVMGIDALEAQADQLRELTKICQKELLPFEHLNVTQTLRLLAEGQRPQVIRAMPLIDAVYQDDVEIARDFAKRLFPNG